MFTVPSKTPAEKKVITFPFGSEARIGAILTSPNVVKSLIDGTDTGAALLVVGTPQIQGLNLLVLAEAGGEGNNYGFLATVQDDDGEVHQLAASMKVTAAAA